MDLHELTDGAWSVTGATHDGQSAVQLSFRLSGIANLDRRLYLSIERLALTELTTAPLRKGQECSRLADPALGGRPSFADRLPYEVLDEVVTLLITDGIESCQERLREIADQRATERASVCLAGKR